MEWSGGRRVPPYIFSPLPSYKLAEIILSMDSMHSMDSVTLPSFMHFIAPGFALKVQVIPPDAGNLWCCEAYAEGCWYRWCSYKPCRRTSSVFVCSDSFPIMKFSLWLISGDVWAARFGCWWWLPDAEKKREPERGILVVCGAIHKSPSPKVAAVAFQLQNGEL